VEAPSRVVLPLFVVGLAVATFGCRTTTSATQTLAPVDTGPIYVAAPTFVYDSVAQLGPASFAAVRWGVDDASTLREGLELQRYDLLETRWGPPGEDVPVVEVRTARRASVTALLFDADADAEVIRTILVRELPATPPAQSNVFDFLPYLSAFPGRILIYTYAEEDDTHGLPYQFLFFPGLGVKLGLGGLDDGTWVLDHVEYFDPEWDVDELDEYKYGGRLTMVGTITVAERK
jgi:hypothetical protein